MESEATLPKPKSFLTQKNILIGASILSLTAVIISALVISRGNSNNSTSKDLLSRNQNSMTVTPTLPIFTDTTMTPTSTSVPSQLVWQQVEGGWRSMETPAACDEVAMAKPPIDLSKATGILYPGQTRGGNYKPHGGFRLDKSLDNNVSVIAPFDGFIVRGGSYLAEGEIQYTFDVMNNCGVMYRVGHFRELPRDMLELTKSWPQPMEGDSRTHQVNPPVYIKEGHELATAIGIKKSKNVFFDLGIYDYRKQNDASKITSFQQKHQQDKELSWHAVCWFDWMSSENEASVRALPAGDPQSGKNSDYCK